MNIETFTISGSAIFAAIMVASVIVNLYGHIAINLPV